MVYQVCLMVVVNYCPARSVVRRRRNPFGEAYIRGTSTKRRTRGKTTCTLIHARSFEEREEIIFEKGQAVGPGNRASELSNFLGTIVRNPRFITLLYTSWTAMPKEVKECMWEYVNSKYIIPKEGRKWVMEGLRNTWRQHKMHVKEKHFDLEKYTFEEMLENHPEDIPEDQFAQLLKYWMLPEVQEQSRANSERRKKQKYNHRMGPINFGRVRVELRDSKEDYEEPSQTEMFIAARTKTGKEVALDTQVVISELDAHQKSGETADEAFKAVLGKEQPGRIRCYGRTMTATSLKKYEEIDELKQKHAQEVTSLKSELEEYKNKTDQELGELRNFMKLVLQNNPGLHFDETGFHGSNIPSPVDASSARAMRGQSQFLSAGSTHGLDKGNTGAPEKGESRKSI